MQTSQKNSGNFAAWKSAHAHLEIAQKSTSWTALLGGLSHLRASGDVDKNPAAVNIPREHAYQVGYKWVKPLNPFFK